VQSAENVRRKASWSSFLGLEAATSLFVQVDGRARQLAPVGDRRQQAKHDRHQPQRTTSTLQHHPGNTSVSGPAASRLTAAAAAAAAAEPSGDGAVDAAREQRMMSSTSTTRVQLTTHSSNDDGC